MATSVFNTERLNKQDHEPSCLEHAADTSGPTWGFSTSPWVVEGQSDWLVKLPAPLTNQRHINQSRWRSTPASLSVFKQRSVHLRTAGGHRVKVWFLSLILFFFNSSVTAAVAALK